MSETATAISADNTEPAFPSGPIGGPAAWRGAQLAQQSDWIHHFTVDDLAEIDAAVAAHEAAGRNMGDITPETFQLPTLAPKLGRLLEDVLHGRGFTVLRGFPVERYSIEQAATAYLGIGAHLGSFRSQNAKGHLLGHVRDLGLDINQPTTRYYQTNRELEFHTDSADIVALLCLRPAKSGGASRIVSSVTLHDILYAERPDLWRVLFNAFPTDRRGEIPPGMQPWFDLPVFNWYRGELTTIYVGQYIRSAQENFPGARRLSALEHEAIDEVDRLCDDPALNLSMELKAGDMQFLHNHQILHARSDFEDWPDPQQRRHLLRLWLSPATGRPLPPAFAQRYGSLTPGDRGGIVTSETRLTFTVDPA